MANRFFLLGKLTPYRNNSALVTDSQSSRDIMAELIRNHERNAADYDKISPYFWRGNIKESCRYLFTFLKENVKYKIEPDTRQSVKSPAAILATGLNGYNDCKHYASFIGGVLDSWNRSGKKINWAYRFANYKLFNKTPHHVFIVVKTPGGEIWVDPVLSYFNEKKQYVNKIDKKPNMALYRISGIGCNCDYFGEVELDSIGQRRTRAERKQRRKVKRQARRTGESCTGRQGAKYAPPLILARRAYLLLVRLNFRNTAVKLHYILENPITRVKALEKWCSLGGNAAKLKSTVAKAWAKYARKRGIAIGAPAAAGLAATWATAAPIIAAMAPIIKLAATLVPRGSRAQEILEAGSEAAEEIQQQQEPTEGETTSGISFSNAAPIIGIAALAGLYFLSRKK